MLLKEVDIFTDGACRGNPGPGGYGVILEYQQYRKELSGGFARTTNNRMELFAAIVGLEALKEPCQVKLYSDSKYLVHAFQKGWLTNWQARGWRKSDKSPVLNQDLWIRLLKAEAPHTLSLHWVKGHAQNPRNNRCDELAGKAAAAKSLPEDPGFDTGVF
ncbi:MAG: ribonuclease HI [Lentisphaeria bacterium]